MRGGGPRKQAGNTRPKGKRTACVLLNGEFDDPVRMAQLDTANLLKHFPGASLEVFLKQKEDEESKQVVERRGVPPISSACLAASAHK